MQFQQQNHTCCVSSQISWRIEKSEFCFLRANQKKSCQHYVFTQHSLICLTGQHRAVNSHHLIIKKKERKEKKVYKNKKSQGNRKFCPTVFIKKAKMET